MLPKKDSQDAVDKGNLTLRTHIPSPIHEFVVVYKDFANVKSTSIGDLNNESNSVDDQTPNIWNQNSLHRFGSIESVVRENFKAWP